MLASVFRGGNLQDREIQDLKIGIFRIECSHMVLSNGDPSFPRRFEGPGNIHLDEDGQLRLVLYDTSCRAGSVLPLHTERSEQIVSWSSEADLFDLKATDLSGRVWVAGNLTPNIQAFAPRTGVVVRTHLDSLSCDWPWELGGRDWMHMYFAQHIDLPANAVTTTTVRESGTEHRRRNIQRNIWSFKWRCIDVRVRRGEAGYSIDAEAESDGMPSNFSTCITEAMWFALGQPLTADIIEFQRGDQQGIEIHSRGRGEKLSTRAQSPYRLKHADSAEVLGAIACKYLGHVSACDSKDWVHPLSTFVRKALRSQDRSLEEFALTLSVVIEGIIDLGFEDLGKPAQGVSKVVDEVMAHLGEYLLSDQFSKSVLNLSDSGTSDKNVIEARGDAEADALEYLLSDRFRDRVLGSIRRIKETSPRTALRELARRRVITEEQVEAWEHLRHTPAHGKAYAVPRKAFELTFPLRVLMNRLVLELIGYAGSYTDYGTVGSPTLSHDSLDTAVS